MKAFENLRDKIISTLQNVNLKSAVLSNPIKSLLIIQHQFLMLSYIFEQKNNSFFYIVATTTRPQLLLHSNNICYLVLPILLLYIVSIFVKKIPGRQKILVIGQLLRVSVYNVFFEISRGELQFVVQILLIIISTIDILFILGTLNIRQRNFSQISINYFQIANHILNNLILIFKQYSNYSHLIITMLCMLYSLNGFLNQIIYSPIKSIKLHPYILYAHLITIIQCVIYFADIKLNEFPNLILCSLILKLTQMSSEIQLKFPVQSLESLLLNIGDGCITSEHIKIIINKKLIQKEQDRILYATIRIKQKHYYEALCLLYNQKSLNWLNQIKKTLIIDECLQQLEFKIKTSSKFDQSVALAVEQLMKSEDRNFIIQEKIIEIIKQKQHIQKCITERDLKIYQKLMNFVNKVQEVKRKLEKQYSQFPNQKTQAILSFLYAEILNDYISASKLSLSASKQELIKLQNHQAIFNMFNSKMIYFITDFDQQRLIIKRMSSNTSQLLNLRHDQLINKDIDQLLPWGIREHHNEMIMNFLEEGISKYMRKVDLKYFKSHQSSYLITADFTLDISFTKSSLKFVTFLQPVIHQPMIIVLNQNKIIKEFSENLIETLNEKPENILNKHMNQFLPSIDTIEFSQVLENVEMISQQSSYSTLKSYSIITTVNVKIKELKGRIIYYLLTFQFIKKMNQNYTFNQMVQSFSNGALSQDKTDAKTTEMKIKVEDDRFSGIFKEDITVSKPYIMDEQNQRHQANSTFFQFQQFSNNYLSITQDKQKRTLQPNQVLPTKSQNNSTLISPNNSVFYDQLLFQQQYFSRNSQKQLSYVKEECSIDMVKELHAADDSNQEEDCKRSQVSSVQNLKQSQHFKKYQILNNVNRQQCHLGACLFLRTALFSLIAHSIIIYIIIQSLYSSLNQLVRDIELLQVKNQAFQPLETFWVNRWIIFNYMKMKQNHLLDEDEYNQLLIFPEYTIPLQFLRLQSNLNEIVNKKELLSSMSSINIKVLQYIDSDEGEIYEISIRSCINILLEFQYTLKQFYVQKQQPQTDSAYIYYSYKNSFNLKQQFQILNDNIYEQSQINSIYILTQQRVLYLIESILIIANLIILIVLIKIVEKQHLKHLRLLFYCPKETYYQDIQNYQLLTKFILKDSDNLFKYQFSVHDKERHLLKSNSRHMKSKDQMQNKKNNKDIKIQVGDLSVRILSFLIMFLLLIQGTYVYLMMSSYIKSYQPTAQFYRQLSDVGTDIPTLYSHISVLYGISNFTFLGYDDKEKFITEIQESLWRLENFVNVQNDQENILSQNFMNNYDSLQTANLCNYINEEIYDNAPQICNLSLNQNLQRGISSVLIYILNSIKTERDLNQFTEKIGYDKYELEGALIFSEFIEHLNGEFYEDLKSVTIEKLNQLIFTVIGIFCVLIFMMFFTLTVGKFYLTNKNNAISQSIFMIPFSVIFFDDYYELKLKKIQQKAFQSKQIII
ncbi:unnamed protein product (macronuclear) [Paramecium tetraurelia]|uniref:PAS domain-containing protein n=1 Tax=Paramecium tetraurelia TaxID=5888 RepID=A0EFA1_PARTE|nr:uncharacterized protein GSPATT00026315001 [Paramecium tetraurelia]CAK93992.1 unnamed protein product [Paramecium tetraurelia]|eukprot:XP_001461365.1 hypothetical protein (macronuclear) [Paramecium tetraurelia strain d4-2]